MSASVINAPKGNPNASKNTPNTNKGTTSAPKSTSATCNRESAVQCQIKFEKYKGGFKVRCRVDQAVCAEFQSLCQAASTGTLTCTCKQNDVQICKFDFTKCECKVENTKDGCCITCTSNDNQVGKTLHAICECMETCCKNDGRCAISFGSTCCCCGTIAA